MDASEHLIRIDPHLESYSTFFDHAWSKRIGNLATGTLLEKLVFALLMSWKSAANTQALPWLLIQNLKHFGEGFVNGCETLAAKLVAAFARNIPQRMNLSNMRKKELAKAIEDVGRATHQAEQQVQLKLDADEIWGMYLRSEIREFHLALWGAPRLCYGAIFHAYENFIRMCIGAGRADPAYRPKHHTKLHEDAKAIFGESIADSLLTEHSVVVARLVRNTIAHNGGMVTAELQAIAHGIEVENGILQVMPPDTKALYNDLKVRALRLVESAVSLPMFHAGA